MTEIGFYSDSDEVGYQVDEVSLSSEQRIIDSVSGDVGTGCCYIMCLLCVIVDPKPLHLCTLIERTNTLIEQSFQIK